MAAQPVVNALEEISRALNKSKEALKATLTRNGKDPSTLSDVDQVQAYLDLVVQKGADHLANAIGTDRAKEAVRQTKGKGTLKEVITQTGLEAFLKQMDVAWLQYVSTVLGLDKSDKHEELVRGVLDEVQLLGTKKLLSETDKATLQLFCTGMELKLEGTKEQLVETLMVDIFQLEPLTTAAPVEEAKRKKDSSRSGSTPKKKPKKEKGAESTPEGAPRSGDEDETPKEYTPRGAQRPPIENIKKGMTYTQLYDLYNKTDLDGFCRTHNIPVSGKKKDLIKKILAHLDGKDVSGKASSTSSKKSKKSSEGSAAAEGDEKSADGGKPMETTETAEPAAAEASPAAAAPVPAQQPSTA